MYPFVEPSRWAEGEKEREKERERMKGVTQTHNGNSSLSGGVRGGVRGGGVRGGGGDSSNSVVNGDGDPCREGGFLTPNLQAMAKKGKRERSMILIN